MTKIALLDNLIHYPNFLLAAHWQYFSYTKLDDEKSTYEKEPVLDLTLM